MVTGSSPLRLPGSHVVIGREHGAGCRCWLQPLGDGLYDRVEILTVIDDQTPDECRQAYGKTFAPWDCPDNIPHIIPVERDP